MKVEDFLRAVATDNVGLGLETLLAGSPLGKDAAQLDKLRTGLPQALEKYGRFKRSERLKVERIGQSLKHRLVEFNFFADGDNFNLFAQLSSQVANHPRKSTKQISNGLHPRLQHSVLQL